MKKRISSIITALALCLSLCPAWAFAAEAAPALCPHHPAHTEDCGCIAPTGGQPCGFVCHICPIKALIAALPDEATPDNADEARARLDEILALFAELAEDEQEQIDLSRVYELQTALDRPTPPTR